MTNPPASNNPSESKRSASSETVTLQVRSFPVDAYETLRRLAFERRESFASVIADALERLDEASRPSGLNANATKR